jgi:enterobacterial common antigen flippase
VSDTPRKSYGQIFKSSALIGGSSVVGIAFGIVRTKAMALLLGPAGVGLLGLYGAISELTRSLAGLGINSSGVRQIAEAVGSGDTRRIACTVTTLRRVALVSGALGALVLVILSKPVSWLTFGDAQHTGAVALLALAVFFGDVSAGQGALIQGMRRIADLARMNVLGALYGTVFAILIVWFYGVAGLVPSLVCAAAMSILTSWWYARKVKVERVRITLPQMTAEASGLLKLGVIFMSSGLMTLGAAYLVRIIILRQINVEAAGFYQAAWALGGLYVGFILQAMGADFYPRLTGAVKDHAECNRLVNEQTEVGLLMAGPGILATLTFAPLVITLFYRADFAPAAVVLRWLCLGMIMRVVTWPMGFIIIAKGARKLFFWTEVLANAGYAGFVWLGVQTLGLQGTGVAFFALYLVHFSVIYLIVRQLTTFRWSAANSQLALLFAPLVAVVFASCCLLPPAAALGVGLVATVASGIYSLRTLCRLLPLERLPQAAQKLFRLLRLTPSKSQLAC